MEKMLPIIQSSEVSFTGYLFKCPIKEEVHHHYSKVSFSRSCQVTVHIPINEPLNAVCNSNSWPLSDNASPPSPPAPDQKIGNNLVEFFWDLKSAEYSMKESKMCIRPLCPRFNLSNGFTDQQKKRSERDYLLPQIFSVVKGTVKSFWWASQV